jgi:hypothetical protein
VQPQSTGIDKKRSVVYFPTLDINNLLRRILILFCLIPFFNSIACNGLEQRSLDLLNNGTEEQQSLFEKIQTGDPLTEEEAELYDQAKIETLKQMQIELRQSLDELPTPETLATSYSGSCSDSTLALSEMT